MLLIDARVSSGVYCFYEAWSKVVATKLLSSGSPQL